MPANWKTMRKIKEVLRLKFEADLSHERIAAATGVSKGTGTKHLQRAREAGLEKRDNFLVRSRTDLARIMSR